MTPQGHEADEDDGHHDGNEDQFSGTYGQVHELHDDPMSESIESYRIGFIGTNFKFRTTTDKPAKPNFWLFCFDFAFCYVPL